MEYTVCLLSFAVCNSFLYKILYFPEILLIERYQIKKADISLVNISAQITSLQSTCPLYLVNCSFKTLLCQCQKGELLLWLPKYSYFSYMYYTRCSLYPRPLFKHGMYKHEINAAVDEYIEVWS